MPDVCVQCCVYPFLEYCCNNRLYVKTYQETVLSSKLSSCNGKNTKVVCVFVQHDWPICVVEFKFCGQYFYLFFQMFFVIFEISVPPCGALVFIPFSATSLCFLKSRAVFTDLSFFRVITAGLTKQSLVFSVQTIH